MDSNYDCELLVKKEDLWKNPNTEYEIPVEIQKKLMNGNAQFIIDLGLNCKVITSLAIHLCQYFFYKRRYINYDRFIVSAACMLLSLKINDTEGAKMRNVCAGYHKTISKVRNEEPGFFDEEDFNRIKEKIIKHESKLIKVLNFRLEIPLPYPVVDLHMNTHFKDKGQIYNLSRVFILDIYRSYACLVHRASTIAMTGLMMAAQNLDITMPPNFKNLNLNKEEIGEEKYRAMQDECLEKWIKEIDPAVKVSDILDCMKIFEELIANYSEVAATATS